MSRPSLRWLLGFCFAFSFAARSPAAADVVRLLGWAEPAVFIPNTAPGFEYFELVADVEWTRGASGRYAVRVELPGGQVDTQTVRSSEGPGASRVTAFVRARAVRDLRPDAVAVRISVLDASTGAAASNVLAAGIREFPYPRSQTTVTDPGPFGWGNPLSGPADQPRRLPRGGPDGLEFIRVPATREVPTYFIATTEASNAQVGRRLKGYDPQAGRSDDFTLEAPNQPAIGLTPRETQTYLKGLSAADPSGLEYRLPTVAEWHRAARAGRNTVFWWGDEAKHPEGANFLGPEPALKTDTTAPVKPGTGTPEFVANPWGLFHTFGNVSEWTVSPTEGFVRLGGHFRSEPESPPTDMVVVKPDSTGPDPYVGVRPAFSLDARTGAELVRGALKTDGRLAGAQVAYDPERSTATLTGPVDDAKACREADRRLARLWFLAAVEDRLEPPHVRAGQLAQLGAIAGPVRRTTPLGHRLYEVPVAVLWADPLPVAGSHWFVNVFLPNGGVFSHRLVESEPTGSNHVTVAIDATRLSAAGLGVDRPVTVALSLGAEASGPSDPRVVSNVAPLRWRLP